MTPLADYARAPQIIPCMVIYFMIPWIIFIYWWLAADGKMLFNLVVLFVNRILPSCCCLLKVKRIIGLVYLLIWTLFFLGILVYQLSEAKASDSLNLVLVWEYLKKTGLLLLHSITSDMLKPSEYPPVILLKYNCQ